MKFTVKTKGHNDVVNISEEIKKAVAESKVKQGMVFVFTKGSTVALTTLEYEEGVIEDLKKVFEQLAPEDADYQHHQKWGDHNGAAHIRSALMKTDLAFSIEESRIYLGTWQQIVLIDFDERPREREIIVKVVIDTTEQI